MAWSTPNTATPGHAVNAADFNKYVRDNLNMTAPALATTDGYIGTTGAHTLQPMLPVSAQRTTDTVITTDVSMTNLSSTSVTTYCSAGALALLDWNIFRTGQDGSNMIVRIHLKLDSTEVFSARARIYNVQGGVATRGFSWGEYVPTGSVGDKTFQLAYSAVWDGYQRGDTVTIDSARLTILPF